MKYLLPIVLLIFLSSCSPSEKQKAAISSKDTVDQDPLLQKFSNAKEMARYMVSPVDLDSLLRAITFQQRVRVLDTLVGSNNVEVYSDKNHDRTEWITTYRGKLFTFKLKEVQIGEDYTTIFLDGETEIDFSKNKVSFPPGSSGNSYGYNNHNMFYNPVVADVCGKKFLYAELLHRCNGIGCGISLTMIYDLQYKKAVFISNYRVDFEGFYLSDFNNDQQPDLLLFNQTDSGRMQGFDLAEHEMELYAYTYDKGDFVLSTNPQYHRPIKMRLYGIAPDDHYISAEAFHWSLLVNEWFGVQ